MNVLLRIAYSAAGAAARAGAVCAPASSAKFLRSLSARRGIRSRYAAWSTAHRDASKPLVWLHAPSVGEGLQARPVIERLRARHRGLQIAYTFYSPSAEKFAQRVGADFADYLPFDTAADADAALDALKPAAIIFSKLDVWPILAERAAARGVKLGMVSATLSAESARRSGLGAALLRDAYAALDAVGAISADDAARLLQLGVRGERIAITGDARYDEAFSRVKAGTSAATLALLAPLRSDRPTLVAGSTWPADETPLLEAWKVLRERAPNARLIIAPHEPVAPHLDAIERWARKADLSCARLGSAEASGADVIVVDRVGVLVDLYALATVAYIGGGFHSAGLHSVIEPAAFGMPVIFGPRHSMSRDAALLIECGGGFTVSSATELAVRTIELFENEKARATAGSQARALVEAGLGAADKSAALVEKLIF